MRTIGLMSGTSMDGVDAVLALWDGETVRIEGHLHAPFAPALRAELFALQQSGPNELHRAAIAANQLCDQYCAIVGQLLEDTGQSAAAITAIGAHGQTVRHQPQLGYTIQLNSPARLAELCGIDVIADFRGRDVAAGGHGAPLVPAFHAGVFSDPERHRVILNLGGIANLTDLPPAEAGSVVRGWDCGPGNLFLDYWAARNTGAQYDASGAWAAGGRVDDALLDRLCDDVWFALAPPKSTGRDLFNEEWLNPRLSEFGKLLPRDVQATLAEFSARVIAESIASEIPAASEVVACGGGAFNTDLLNRIARQLNIALGREVPVAVSSRYGWDPAHVEALAFAWLARRFVLGEPGNLASVTGARGSRILGALYPSGPRA